MPPKTIKSKQVLKSTDNTQNFNEPSTSTTSSLPPELEQQFEMELCWCIKQLQIALKSGKLNGKQVQDHTKALNALMSNTAPIIKKRQVMRLSFGDYRAKMAAEEKKCSRNIINWKVKPAIPSKKSVFVKKSTFASSGNKFAFNFEPPNDELSKSVQNISIELADTTPQVQNKDNKDFTFLTSDNSFRFGFDVKE